MPILHFYFVLFVKITTQMILKHTFHFIWYNFDVFFSIELTIPYFSNILLD